MFLCSHVPRPFVLIPILIIANCLGGGVRLVFVVSMSHCLGTHWDQSCHTYVHAYVNAQPPMKTAVNVAFTCSMEHENYPTVAYCPL